MRKPVIAGNWKMFKLAGEAVASALEIKRLVAGVRHCEIIIAPVFTVLSRVADRLDGSNVSVAAQNCATQNETGALTGEVSAAMLADIGCTHAIIGHSERRQLFCETDETVSRKASAALAAGLTPIVCVGETLAERESGNAEKTVSTQLKGSLARLTAADAERIIIAYEPVWAIGTGKTASPEQAQEMHGFIRRTFATTHGTSAGESLRILYGGSVKPDNIAALMDKSDIDGALVGGASLDAVSFARIVNYQ